MGWPTYFQEIIIGLVIIVAVFLDRLGADMQQFGVAHDRNHQQRQDDQQKTAAQARANGKLLQIHCGLPNKVTRV